MGLPRVYADFHNPDEHCRLRLDGPGTREDLARQGLALAEGLPLLLYDDDTQPDGTSGELVVEGVVEATQPRAHGWRGSIGMRSGMRPRASRWRRRLRSPEWPVTWVRATAPIGGQV